MAIQCNQYPNPSHNLALPQFLAHHNCEDLDPTDTPSAIPTTIQAPKLCTHNPSTSQVKKSNHTNPVTLPYPPDPGEHVMEMSAAPTTLVKRDKLDLFSLVPPKGEMGSSFSWTCPFKSPTSSTLCFGEPTLGKLKHMPKASSGTNRVSVSHSSLVTKNGEHFYGENFIYDSPKSLKHIKEADWGDKLKLNFTTYGYMLMEIDWEANSTTPHVDVLWLIVKIIKHTLLDTTPQKLIGVVMTLTLTMWMSPCSLKLIGEHITQVRSLESDILYVFLSLGTQVYKYICVSVDHWFFWVIG